VQVAAFTGRPLEEETEIMDRRPLAWIGREFIIKNNQKRRLL
jgi:hypothetical protein